jgi:serine/threonine protein kinase
VTDLSRLSASLADRYRVEREIGRGGMATVYLARDIKHDRDVAIKVLNQDLSAAIPAERFHREIRIQAKLRHPHVVPLLDSGEADGLLYYIMPYVEGQSLRQRLMAGPLDVGEALRLWRDVVDGIAYAHRNGVLHRDIKPENILISERHAMVADFGVAKALGAGLAAPGAGQTLTSVGVAIGTPAYMSPEQVSGDTGVDHHADIYALGIVAYEMFGGTPPFTGTTPQSVFAAHISEEPRPLEEVRPDIPASLAAAVHNCLHKDPARRWRSADELLATLEAYSTPHPDATKTYTARPLSRRRIAVVAGVMIVALGAGAWAFSARQSRARWARDVALPELRRLVDARTLDSAFVLGQRVREILPDHGEADSLLRRSSGFIRVTSAPPGARVSWGSYAPDSIVWHPLGVTPLDSAPAPGMSLSIFPLLRIEHSGQAPAVLPLQPALSRDRTNPVTQPLVAANDTTMVPVFAQRVLVPLPSEIRPMRLAPFAIDRYEVTNADFKRFVDAGGYTRHEFWDALFTGPSGISWDVVRRFVDRTGRPGPATWEAGAPPAGQERHPVSGVSWYEAAAYARFAGKSLPTVHQWRAVAGMQRSAWILPTSNFGGTGPLPVDGRRGMGPFGTFDMAGNVREWCLNADGERRYILGGAWDDMPWLFTDAITEVPLNRAPHNGFRLVRAIEPQADSALLAGPFPRGVRDYARERVRPEAEVRGYRTLFAYDESPLNARVESADSSDPSMIRQTVSFDAAYPGHRVRLHLLLPRNARPPYQTVVYLPGANAFFGGNSLWMLPSLSFVALNGRAVAYPVVKNHWERASPDVSYASDPVHNMSGGLLGPNTYRDETIMQVKDVRRSLDYLSTRPDIDTARFAYSGYSWGGRLGPMMVSVEPRFKVAMYYTPGLLTAPRLPQVDDVNFLASAKIPTLIQSGRYDDVFPLQAMAMPFVERLGTPAEHKRHLIYESQHYIPRAEQIKETLNWLDRYFGAPR